MRVLLFGQEIQNITPLVESAGFSIVKENPEAIVSYGGDGTILGAENHFPGIPKLVLRGSKICKRCSPLKNEEVLERVASGKFQIEKYWKVEASAKGKILYAMNDIVVHNRDPRHGLRYQVQVNGRIINNEVIGDGVVVASPYGSTAYYRSITDSFFEVGLGIAFNNSTEQADHIILKEDSVIKIKVARGPAIVYADNQEEVVETNEGDEIIIKKSDKLFQLIKV